MNIEEIVKELSLEGSQYQEMIAESSVSDHVKEGWRKRATALREAVAKLKTHPDAKPNEPLTLEELRGMDGQPAWVKTPGVDNDISGRWVIVEGVNLDERTLYTRGDFSCHDYGKVWIAYRRPPKESVV